VSGDEDGDLRGEGPAQWRGLAHFQSTANQLVFGVAAQACGRRAGDAVGRPRRNEQEHAEDKEQDSDVECQFDEQGAHRTAVSQNRVRDEEDQQGQQEPAQRLRGDLVEQSPGEPSGDDRERKDTVDGVRDAGRTRRAKRRVAESGYARGSLER
jgi:hypothetical protein